MVKSENISPVQSNQIFYDTSSAESVKLPSPAVSDKGTEFSTDVDTLMKAIQSKVQQTQPVKQQQQQQQQIQQPIPVQKVFH